MTSVSSLLDEHPLASVAWRAAMRASQFLRDERPTELTVEVKSTPTDAVTEMDRGAEMRIIDALLADRPDDGILGEEGGERPGSSGVRWVVDPLDGTVNYLYGHPNWGVSIAAEEAGEAVVGVVIAPALGESYVAIRGRGAWSVLGAEATRIRVSGCTDLSRALVATGFGYAAETRSRQGEVVARLLPRIRDIRRGGGAVVDFAWLATGRLDAFYESGLNRWDIAAGALIASEAGAVVGSLVGASPFEGVMVAAAPGIDESLRQALIECGADVR